MSPAPAALREAAVPRAHGAHGGDDAAVEFVIGNGELRGGRPAPPDDKPRVPFPDLADFAALTARALERAASEAGDMYGRVLALLLDCRPLEHLAHEQQRGASYKRLAAIAHAAGMSKPERVGWYRVAEEIPLADRHAGHILSKLKRAAA